MLLYRVKKTIQKYGMVQTGDRVLVGVSGGPDSVALLHILSRLRDELGLVLFVAHLNHMMRPEAESDADYVRQLSQDLGAVCLVEKCDVRQMARRLGVGEEVAGRMARYSFFSRAASTHGCTRIALGHNMDDQAETVLMRLIRGAGMEGMCGIPPVRGKIIRPLIETPRADIEAYCRSWQLKTLVDSTNLEDVYLRNRIRRYLVPMLRQEYNPNVVEVLARTAELLREENAYLSDVARKKYLEIVTESQDRVELQVEAVQRLELPIRRRVVRFACCRAGGPSALDFHHVNQVIESLNRGDQRWTIHLPGRTEVFREGDRIVFVAQQGVTRGIGVTGTPVLLNVPGVTSIPWADCSIRATLVPRDSLGDAVFSNKLASVAYVDYNSVELPLTARPRNKGDRMYPLGLGGSKKLKEIFRARGTELQRRDKVPVITSSDGRIVWVVDHAVDDRFKVVPATQQVLVLECIREGGGA
ncbi:MAG: tRNA lysidine(34) synthetase TilS [Bacillota bacterium]